MHDWLWYGTKDLQLVPYMPGTPIYKDGVVSSLYYRTKEEDKLKTIFCGDELNHDQFVAYFEKRKTLQILCRVEDNKDLKPVGYCWVDNPKGQDGARSAMCGFCFFDGASDTTTARDLGMLGLAFWFTALKIDVIHGIMLEKNFAGRNFAQHLGFTQCAIVPSYHYLDGELVGARVMICSEAGWMPMFEQWREQNPVAPSE